MPTRPAPRGPETDRASSRKSPASQPKASAAVAAAGAPPPAKRNSSAVPAPPPTPRGAIRAYETMPDAMADVTMGAQVPARPTVPVCVIGPKGKSVWMGPVVPVPKADAATETQAEAAARVFAGKPPPTQPEPVAFQRTVHIEQLDELQHQSFTTAEHDELRRLSRPAEGFTT